MQSSYSNPLTIASLVLIAGFLSSTLQSRAATLATEHVDIGVAYEAGEWDLHIHDETHDIEYEPRSATLQVNASAATQVPADPRFSFLGRSGSPLYLLPQSGTPDLLFLGVAAEEIGNGVFAKNMIELRLTGFAGPGDFHAYVADGLTGDPVRAVFAMRGSVDARLHTFTVLSLGHQDYNWAFTAPGDYHLTFQAAGDLVGGGRTSSGEATYHFHVVPEPSFIVLMSLTFALLLFGRRCRTGGFRNRQTGSLPHANHQTGSCYPMIPSACQRIRPVSRTALLLSMLPGLVATPSPADNRVVIRDQHADIRMLYQPTSTPSLRLAIHDSDVGTTHSPTDVVMWVDESARLEIPSGTPFGNAGDPLWILPQNQFPDRLYLGFSAEPMPRNIFTSALTIRLLSVKGPGRFLAWQAASFGEFLIRFDTVDGISDEDRSESMAGSHEHLNWGFSAPGVYAVTLQLEGTRTGESRPIRSEAATFVFHVAPLPRPSTYADWIRRFWHPSQLGELGHPSADPDGDSADNLDEYAADSLPGRAGPVDSSSFAIIEAEGTLYAAWKLVQREGAGDLIVKAEWADELWGPWVGMTEIAEGPDEVEGRLRWTVRDATPFGSRPARFYRHRLELR